MQLQQQVTAFLLGDASGSLSDSEGDGGGVVAPQLPKVEHAPGFERYKVTSTAVHWCRACPPIAMQPPLGSRCAWPPSSPRALARRPTRRTAQPASSPAQLSVLFARAPQGVNTSEYAHEAGYDAYMTGAVRRGPCFAPQGHSPCLRTPAGAPFWRAVHGRGLLEGSAVASGLLCAHPAPCPQAFACLVRLFEARAAGGEPGAAAALTGQQPSLDAVRELCWRMNISRCADAFCV